MAEDTTSLEQTTEVINPGITVVDAFKKVATNNPQASEVLSKVSEQIPAKLQQWELKARAQIMPRGMHEPNPNWSETKATVALFGIEKRDSEIGHMAIGEIKDEKATAELLVELGCLADGKSIAEQARLLNAQGDPEKYRVEGGITTFVFDSTKIKGVSFTQQTGYSAESGVVFSRELTFGRDALASAFQNPIKN